jgi:tetratricopeptide (TPR) repeat protein
MTDGMIEVLDEYGNPVQMPRVEYARQIMDYARAHWGELEALRPLIVQMLQGAFFAEALEFAQRTCELSSEHVNDLYWRAVSKAELGLLDQAAQEFEQLREDAAYPADQARAAVGEARVRAKLGQMEPAAHLLEEAVEIDPNNPAPMVSLYAFWHEQNQPETGMAKLQQMAHRYPTSAGPHRALAQRAVRDGDREAVLSHARAALAKAAPQQRDEVVAEVTWLYGESKMPEEIVALLEPEIQSRLNPQALLNLAQAYIETEQLDKARALLERARGELPPELHPIIEMKLRQMNPEA